MRAAYPSAAPPVRAQYGVLRYWKSEEEANAGKPSQKDVGLELWKYQLEWKKEPEDGFYVFTIAQRPEAQASGVRPWFPRRSSVGTLVIATRRQQPPGPSRSPAPPRVDRRRCATSTASDCTRTRTATAG